jgi:hypothetical protein
MKTAILVGAIVALLAANVYMYLQLDRVKTDMAKLVMGVLGVGTMGRQHALNIRRLIP